MATAAAGQGQMQQVERGSASPGEPSPEGFDECSHNDLLDPHHTAAGQVRLHSIQHGSTDSRLEQLMGNRLTGSLYVSKAAVRTPTTSPARKARGGVFPAAVRKCIHYIVDHNACDNVLN